MTDDSTGEVLGDLPPLELRSALVSLDARIGAALNGAKDVKSMAEIPSLNGTLYSEW